MAAAENNQTEEANRLLTQAWQEASDDFEKYTAAYYNARFAVNTREKLNWFETTLKHALILNNLSVMGAFPALYANIAQCYEELNDPENAEKYRTLLADFRSEQLDSGPFYHGTRADLNMGDFLLPGNKSNYQTDLVMNHIYFTALANGAGLAAALANGEGAERVYIIEPTGEFENDPNVTDKRFPGNPTRSYRTDKPLKIIGELKEWERQSPEQIAMWKAKLAGNQGEIVN